MRTLALFILLAAMLPGASARAGSIAIVVTVHPLGLLVEEIATDRADVHVLVPPGASPHSFEPKPSDLVAAARADAFLSIGGGLDDWSSRLFQTAEGDAITASLFALSGRAEASPDRAEHHAHDHEGGEDPHLWLDPILVRDEIVPALVAFLARVDPAGAAQYQARGSQFQLRLTSLDTEVRDALAGDAREYVSFHGAWTRFAERYDLDRVAVVQEAPGEEPTPRELGDLVRAARRAKLGAILIEPQLDPRIAQTLSAEFGGTTVLVDPLGDPNDTERSTYPGLLRFNARAFRQALAQHAQGASSR